MAAFTFASQDTAQEPSTTQGFTDLIGFWGGAFSDEPEPNINFTFAEQDLTQEINTSQGFPDLSGFWGGVFAD